MKGQASSVFKMLIGAVFAVALLAIVYMVSTQVACPFTPYESIRDLVLDASRAPEKCFERTSICFESGSVITESSLEANLPGIKVNLIDTSKGVVCKGGTCTSEERYEIPVYVICKSFSSGISCDVYINEVCT